MCSESPFCSTRKLALSSFKGEVHVFRINKTLPDICRRKLCWEKAEGQNYCENIRISIFVSSQTSEEAQMLNTNFKRPSDY